jgi:hypothetical protein
LTMQMEMDEFCVFHKVLTGEFTWCVHW